MFCNQLENNETKLAITDSRISKANVCEAKLVEDAMLFLKDQTTPKIGEKSINTSTFEEKRMQFKYFPLKYQFFLCFKLEH